MSRSDIRLWLASGLVALAAPSRAALVASMAVSPPGPLFPYQIVTITYTISNTGSAAVNVTVPEICGSGCAPSNPSVAPAGKLSFDTYQGGSNTGGMNSGPANPYTLVAGGQLTLRWFARVEGAGDATVSFSMGSPAAPASLPLHLLTSAEAFAAKGPGTGTIEVRNNIVRLEHRTTAVILIHGPAGALVYLNLYGPSGAAIANLPSVTLDGSGQGSYLFDPSTGGSLARTGLYWIVASGGVKDRKPILIMNYSTRNGAKDAY